MYKVKLKEFEGPLDLLLSLVEEEKLDITRISLAKVTDQYLEYLKKIEKINPSALADFLDVAAKLILIKSKALLPVLELTSEEEEGIEDLEAQLKRYQVIKEAAKKINRLLKEGKIAVPRESYLGLQVSFYPPQNLGTALALKKYFLRAASNLPSFEDLPKEVVRETVSIGEMINNIQKRIKKTFELSFDKVVKKAKTKTDVIISFLAILELIKQRVIVAEQKGLFSEISIYSKKDKPEYNYHKRKIVQEK